MNPEVRSRWLAWSAQFEGRYAIIYADIKGLPTTAEGNLLPDAASALRLPWKRKADNGLATRDEIVAEWNRVNGNERLAKAGAEQAKREATIYLSEADIDKLVLERLDANDAIFAGQFREWATLDYRVQMVVHSIGWACGPHFGFPKFRDAIKRHAWGEAAIECKIPGEEANRGLIPRNEADRTLLLSLASGQQAPPVPVTPPAAPTSRPWWQGLLDMILRALGRKA